MVVTVHYEVTFTIPYYSHWWKDVVSAWLALNPTAEAL